MTLYVPRESIEFVDINVESLGTPITSGVKIAVVPSGARPATWTDPTLDGSKFVYETTAVDDPGAYDIYAQVSAPPQSPVIYIDTLVRT